MPLVDVDISIVGTVVPDDVATFLREADSRVSQFLRNRPTPASGFVAGDYVAVYHALRAITEANEDVLAPKQSFCEWGSGFGVATSLASLLGLSACGIEIENVLVTAARILASDFGLPANFVHGSFVPPGSEAHTAEAYEENNAEYSWLIKDADNAYEKLALAVDDFDIIYAYPWPGEEYLIEILFEKHAAPGALLLMYSDVVTMRVRTKVETLSSASV